MTKDTVNSEGEKKGETRNVGAPAWRHFRLRPGVGVPAGREEADYPLVRDAVKIPLGLSSDGRNAMISSVELLPSSLDPRSVSLDIRTVAGGRIAETISQYPRYEEVYLNGTPARCSSVYKGIRAVPLEPVDEALVTPIKTPKKKRRNNS